MPSLYRIYFSRDSTVLSLPINPEKLPETKESDNGEYNVLGLGPVMQPRTYRSTAIVSRSFRS